MLVCYSSTYNFNVDVGSCNFFSEKKKMPQNEANVLKIELK